MRIRHLPSLRYCKKNFQINQCIVNTISLREAKASSEIENIFTTNDELYKSLTINTSELKGGSKEIFRFVIEQLKPEKLISYEFDYVENNNENNALFKKSENLNIAKTGLIKKIYPNPFIYNITIELAEKAPCVFKIFDINGKHIKTSKLNTDNMKMELSNLKVGYYILKIYVPKTNLQDEIKLVKKQYKLLTIKQ